MIQLGDVKFVSDIGHCDATSSDLLRREMPAYEVELMILHIDVKPFTSIVRF